MSIMIIKPRQAERTPPCLVERTPPTVPIAPSGAPSEPSEVAGVSGPAPDPQGSNVQEHAD